MIQVDLSTHRLPFGSITRDQIRALDGIFDQKWLSPHPWDGGRLNAAKDGPRMKILWILRWSDVLRCHYAPTLSAISRVPGREYGIVSFGMRL